MINKQIAANIKRIHLNECKKKGLDPNEFGFIRNAIYQLSIDNLYGAKYILSNERDKLFAFPKLKKFIATNLFNDEEIWLAN